jgi:hypothetical protein
MSDTAGGQTADVGGLRAGVSDVAAELGKIKKYLTFHNQFS